MLKERKGKESKGKKKKKKSDFQEHELLPWKSLLTEEKIDFENFLI